MIESVILFVQEYLIPLGPFGVFLAAIIEEIVAPIPSAIITLSAGFFFLSGDWSFGLALRLVNNVVLPISLGITLGSLVIYWVVRRFGDPFIDKFGKWLGIYKPAIDSFRERVGKGSRDEITVFIVRAVPIVPSVVIAAVCGILHTPVRSYIGATFLGTVIRSAFLGVLGWQAGSIYTAYAGPIGKFENLGLAILLLFGLLWVLYRRQKLKL